MTLLTIQSGMAAGQCVHFVVLVGINGCIKLPALRTMTRSAAHLKILAMRMFCCFKSQESQDG